MGKVTLQTNVPMTAECATLAIVNLEGACNTGSDPRSLDLDGTHKAAFENLAGQASKGTWNSVQDEDKGITVGSLTFRPTSDTSIGTAYEFEFSITNPVEGQNSPS